MIYLDTHIVVWSYAGLKQRLSKPIMKIMNQHDWFISPMVRLELEYLYKIGRINSEPDTIISSLSNNVGLTICPKPFNDIISHAMQITWTRDPFDRIIVAHASVDDNILISSDRNIHAHYKFTKW